MKTLVLVSFLTFVNLSSAFAQNKSADETAIRQTLTTARSNFNKKDLTAFTSLFVKSPDLYYQIYTRSGEVILAHGYDAMTHMIGGYMKSNPEPITVKMTESDFKYQIKGNIAWVTSITEGELPDGKKESSTDFILLEKLQNTWKIIALIGQEYNNGKLIEVK